MVSRWKEERQSLGDLYRTEQKCESQTKIQGLLLNIQTKEISVSFPAFSHVSWIQVIVEEIDGLFDILIDGNKLIGSHPPETLVLLEKSKKLSIWQTIKLSMALLSPQWFWRLCKLWQTALSLFSLWSQCKQHSSLLFLVPQAACSKINSPLETGSAKPFPKFTLNPNPLTTWKERASGRKRQSDVSSCRKETRRRK